MYRYRIQSDRDPGENGSTSVWFDANTGMQHALYLSTGKTSGGTVSNWLFALHMGTVSGLPYQIFVSVRRVAVALLSVTGVIIWWKKQVSRQVRKLRQAEAACAIRSSELASVTVPKHFTLYPSDVTPEKIPYIIFEKDSHYHCVVRATRAILASLFIQ